MHGIVQHNTSASVLTTLVHWTRSLQPKSAGHDRVQWTKVVKYFTSYRLSLGAITLLATIRHEANHAYCPDWRTQYMYRAIRDSFNGKPILGGGGGGLYHARACRMANNMLANTCTMLAKIKRKMGFVELRIASPMQGNTMACPNTTLGNSRTRFVKRRPLTSFRRSIK